jgi:hypothetical protein
MRLIISIVIAAVLVSTVYYNLKPSIEKEKEVDILSQDELVHMSMSLESILKPIHNYFELDYGIEFIYLLRDDIQGISERADRTLLTYLNYEWLHGQMTAGHPLISDERNDIIFKEYTLNETCSTTIKNCFTVAALNVTNRFFNEHGDAVFVGAFVKDDTVSLLPLTMRHSMDAGHYMTFNVLVDKALSKDSDISFHYVNQDNDSTGNRLLTLAQTEDFNWHTEKRWSDDDITTFSVNMAAAKNIRGQSIAHKNALNEMQQTLSMIFPKNKPPISDDYVLDAIKMHLISQGLGEWALHLYELQYVNGMEPEYDIHTAIENEIKAIFTTLERYRAATELAPQHSIPLHITPNKGP